MWCIIFGICLIKPNTLLFECDQVEILRSESLSKDRSLAEEVRMGTAAHYARDSLRIEHNRCNNILRDKKEMVWRNRGVLLQYLFVKIQSVLCLAFFH